MKAGEPRLNAERSASVTTLACERCGAALDGAGRAGRRFCSDRCRAAASRDRATARVRKLEALIGELAKVAGGQK